MADKVEVKPDALLNLDDLLQCPVCYEIPTGQIFQCNEGHHVCGRCKIRLDVCPVCRALFFGTRNYAMEELIANFRKLKTFKVGGKLTTGSGSENSAPACDSGSGENENDTGEDEENNPNIQNQITLRAPPACKGLFRCLCCKNGNAERLPSARLLNHLRYFHSSDLIEGQSDRGEYAQAWQFSTSPGRLVTAVRVSDMDDTLCAWLTMASSPWVAHGFSYTVTISGNDREAIFSDCVWSVRSCEGSLKKRGHCLVVRGSDAIALTAPSALNGKLTLRRTPPDQLAHQTQPRAVMRVANRGNNRDDFYQDLHENVARLRRAFANYQASSVTLIEAQILPYGHPQNFDFDNYEETIQNAVLELTERLRPMGQENLSSAQMSSHPLISQPVITRQLRPQTLPSQTLPPQTLPPQTLPPQTLPPQTLPPQTLPSQTLPPQTLPPQTLPSQTLPSQTLPSQTLPSQPLPPQTLPSEALPLQPLSRNARRRLRQRLRMAFNTVNEPIPHTYSQVLIYPRQNGHVANNDIQREPVPTPSVAQAQTNGPSTSNQPSQNGNQGRNKKKRRQRR